MAGCGVSSKRLWECAHYRKPGGTVEVWCMVHDDGMERVRCVVATPTTTSACGHSHVMMRMMGWMMWNAGGTDECGDVPGGPWRRCQCAGWGVLALIACRIRMRLQFMA